MTEGLTEGVESFLGGTGTSTQRPEETTAAMREWQNAEAKLFYRTITPNDVVLENGCGIGRVIGLIEKCHVQIVGIDCVGTLAKRTALKYNGQQGITILQADARWLPFCGDAFDIVICAYNTLGNIESPGDSKAVSEMSRVMRKGGRIVSSVYSENALSAQLECYSRAGWNVTSYNHEVVRLDNGWTSRRFSQEALHQLFDHRDLDVTIRSLTDIAWSVIATKVK